ncbi:uncharacterized protein RSE6_07604 [Rhynchosporium secalis]|uniref:Uncharacterized protein n=1 Tax=Rhynchosporium secalis TaxID=38038 RepID=A0A1E1MDD8_RHYSE|nr:uncharacterized protein RSE6_07604 [Rhynchosporium secalis]
MTSTFPSHRPRQHQMRIQPRSPPCPKLDYGDDPNSNESSRTRELLFGALLLGAKSSVTRPAAVLASAAVDVLDLVATIWGWEMGQGITAGIFTFAAGASASLAGLAWKKAGLGRALTTRKL